ncbi:MAG: isoprenyl transferase [Microbacter sp.]
MGKSLTDQIDKTRLPIHVAIIMDGNGRWALKQGYNRIFGHHQALNAVREITEAASELGIKYLTLYTFSMENWDRPGDEINALMELLANSIEKETPSLHENHVRLLAIGDEERLPPEAQKKLNKSIELTANNTGLTLILALSYSARWEIVHAVKMLCQKVITNSLSINDIDEKTFASHLTTKNIPDPDLLIRTSGEIRISNFLLWQLAYSELYFTETLWPDFKKADLYKAIVEYQSRERRFGKTGEQLKQRDL